MRLSTFEDVGGAVAAIVAALALVGAIRAGYRKTFGRKRDLRQRLARLGTGAQLSFLTSVLGQPPAMRRSVEWDANLVGDDGHPAIASISGHENVYIDDLCFVQALTDEDETVQAYSVTTRSRRFHPRWICAGGYMTEASPWDVLMGRNQGYQPAFDVRLGKTTFDALRKPDWAMADQGARRFQYLESHYFGNPGHYQTFVFSVNDAGVGAFDAAEGILFDGPVPRKWDFQDETPVDAFPNLASYRSRARINTLTVMNQSFGPKGYPVSFGVDGDLIRTLIIG